MSSGMWHRTLVYLGLKEEPEEEEHGELPERFVPEDDPYAEHAAPRAGGTRIGGGARIGDGARGASRAATAAVPEPARAGAGTAVDDRAPDTDGATVRPLRASGDVHVRPVANVPVARAAVVELDGFDDVEAIGARYRTGQAVLFDVSGAPREDGRRVVDFVAGLTYALHGQLTKVGSRAFLLVPDGVHLPADERRRLADLGYRVEVGADE